MRIDLDALFRPRTSHSSGWRRMPAVASRAMVATSHPYATASGLEALAQGGNAVDAALAAATVLTVAEPTDNGPGGDAFAMVWDQDRLYGLNGSGRSPGTVDAGGVDESGPRSVTVPGAVRLWCDLADRFGRLGLDGALDRAARVAEDGLACTPRIAHKWAFVEAPPWPAPAIGEIFRLPELAATLRRISRDGADGFYRGDVARAIAEVTWLGEDDLAAHCSEWVEPLRYDYRGVEVCELPPNGSGAAALLGLALYDGLEPGLHSQIEAMKVALADVEPWLHDGALPANFLAPSRLAGLRALVRPDGVVDLPLRLPLGGTTYVCAVDGDGMAVSLIQSLYASFGSGVVAPGTGVVLQNRAAGFASSDGHPNALGPAKRPRHTIIPGMLLEEGRLLGPFGVMGGPMQPQGHMQVVLRLVDHADDPQAALDAPRWRVEGDGSVLLEPGLWVAEETLRDLGHTIVRGAMPDPFGVGQVILRLGDALIGGSDARGDGYAAGV